VRRTPPGFSDGEEKNPKNTSTANRPICSSDDRRCKAKPVTPLISLTNFAVRQSHADHTQFAKFIAEDVPDLVATADRKGFAPMDESQQEAVADLKTRLARLEALLGGQIK